MKECPQCESKFDSRKKFCTDRCKWLFNVLKKEREIGLPPAKKRNRNFFSMITGYGVAKMPGVRQGKRSGHMVTGSMSARINATVEEWAELTQDNINNHFTAISFYDPNGIKLGDGTWIRKENIKKETGFSPPTK